MGSETTFFVEFITLLQTHREFRMRGYFELIFRSSPILQHYSILLRSFLFICYELIFHSSPILRHYSILLRSFPSSLTSTFYLPSFFFFFVLYSLLPFSSSSSFPCFLFSLQPFSSSSLLPFSSSSSFPHFYFFLLTSSHAL